MGADPECRVQLSIALLDPSLDGRMPTLKVTILRWISTPAYLCKDPARDQNAFVVVAAIKFDVHITKTSRRASVRQTCVENMWARG
jgi:hypothetical protein